MSDALERGYTRLLNFYPAEYRRTYGAELLETLMAVSDGRRRPTVKESAALILGALAALAWLVVDARVATALGLLLLNNVLIQASVLARIAAPGQLADTAVSLGLAVLAPALLLITSATVARHEARI